jgi:hypothetical protein
VFGFPYARTFRTLRCFRCQKSGHKQQLYASGPVCDILGESPSFNPYGVHCSGTRPSVDRYSAFYRQEGQPRTWCQGRRTLLSTSQKFLERKLVCHSVVRTQLFTAREVMMPQLSPQPYPPEAVPLHRTF